MVTRSAHASPDGGWKDRPEGTARIDFALMNWPGLTVQTSLDAGISTMNARARECVTAKRASVNASKATRVSRAPATRAQTIAQATEPAST